MQTDRLLRLPQVLELIPVSKSHFWQGVRTGKYPRPFKLSDRVTVWRESEVMQLVNKGGGEHGN
jgi:prophage regulatory protein